MRTDCAAGCCGLDFGTSNSTLGTLVGNRIELVPLENGEPTLPSALFFDFEAHRPRFGRAAVAAYVAGVEGRLMRSLKSVLGTGLIDEDTQLLSRRIGFREVIGLLVGHVRSTAEAAAGRPLDSVVHGRPVHFVDGDPAADARAETALADIARAAGFRHVSFQYEPIAAALSYESTVGREQVALIADIGGGTSDVSIVRIGPDRAGRPDRADDILANGGVRLGGTDFDRLLSLETLMPALGYRAPLRTKGLLTPNHWYVDLATWSKINFLYVPSVLAAVRRLEPEAVTPALLRRLATVLEHHLGHALAIKAEGAKIELSGGRSVEIDLDAVEAGLTVPASRGQLVTAIAEPVARLGALVRDCLAQAGLRPEQVNAVFLTGGSTLLPAVRGAILAELPAAEPVEGDKFGAVGHGLALEAARRYGGLPADTAGLVA
ncbi:Hsp70 family protein [Rhodospirillum centenum]|uniref:Heat shock protein DnaK, putative n=1 Tax=Rhodospirillum centenum (strain ATCC 51521 / SW) TaxID=414684 RepID=B6IU59_RHOCS|nr:Hsp70 family protein [Rhodospirillum centenum]ACI99936.1 Heat shock protein DnaK, putative [Rhodospirillum centenum SW]